MNYYLNSKLNQLLEKADNDDTIPENEKKSFSNEKHVDFSVNQGILDAIRSYKLDKTKFDDYKSEFWHYFWENLKKYDIKDFTRYDSINLDNSIKKWLRDYSKAFLFRYTVSRIVSPDDKVRFIIDNYGEYLHKKIKIFIYFARKKDSKRTIYLKTKWGLVAIYVPRDAKLLSELNNKTNKKKEDIEEEKEKGKTGDLRSSVAVDTEIYYMVCESLIKEKEKLKKYMPWKANVLSYLTGYVNIAFIEYFKKKKNPKEEMKTVSSQVIDTNASSEHSDAETSFLYIPEDKGFDHSKYSEIVHNLEKYFDQDNIYPWKLLVTVLGIFYRPAEVVELYIEETLSNILEDIKSILELSGRLNNYDLEKILSKTEKKLSKNLLDVIYARDSYTRELLKDFLNERVGDVKLKQFIPKYKGTAETINKKRAVFISRWKSEVIAKTIKI